VPNSSNLGVLADYDPVFLQLATAAERAFSSDPNVTIEQLELESGDPKSFESPGSQPETCHVDDVLSDLSQRVRSNPQ
jgi:type I restriction enzyme R subunit